MSPTDRPVIDLDPRRIRGIKGVRVVLRRELRTKFFTKAFALSTLFFAVVAALLPAALPDALSSAALPSGLTSPLIGFAFAVIAVVVVLLWGIPLATDVMQEKASRVVEILLTSVRPWQLLAGKVIATAIIGLTQVAVVIAVTLVSGRLVSNPIAFGAIDPALVVAGTACLVLAVLTCGALMAGLASRVERQEDLSGVLQPAMGVAMVPLAAAVYLGLQFTDSVWLDIASIAPVFNVFVLPVRMAVESVPVWQVLLSLTIAVITAIGAFRLAGRIYSGAILRSGGRVSLQQAMRAR